MSNKDYDCDYEILSSVLYSYNNSKGINKTLNVGQVKNLGLIFSWFLHCFKIIILLLGTATDEINQKPLKSFLLPFTSVRTNPSLFYILQILQLSLAQFADEN